MTQPVTDPTYAAIAELVFGYAELLDAGDLRGMAALFADATFRSAGPDGIATMTGSEEVYAGFAGSVRMHDGVPATIHVTTNLAVTDGPGPDRVTGRAVFTVLQATATLPLQVVVAGRYRDEFVRTAAGWRFADRLVRITLVGDIRDHLVVPIEG